MSGRRTPNGSGAKVEKDRTGVQWKMHCVFCAVATVPCSKVLSTPLFEALWVQTSPGLRSLCQLQVMEGAHNAEDWVCRLR